MLAFIPHHHLHRLSVLLLAGSLASVSQVSLAATYELDPAHTNVRFAIDHFGTSTNTGGFYNLTGKLEYNPKAKYGHISLIIPIDSLNTGNSEFDHHLKGKDFFYADKYPSARFESTQWYFADGGDHDKSIKVTQVDGNLTLNGVTKPVTLKATKFNCYFSPVLIKSVCGGDFTTTIDRTDWGISKYVKMGMTKEVTLNIQVEALKQ